MDPDNAAAPQYEGTRVGVVTHFFDHVSVAVVKAEDTINVGDKIKVYDKQGNVVVEQVIDSMEIDKQKQETVSTGTEFGLKVEGAVKEGYLVYRQ
jgi:hypothetical protein